ncbi:MAG: NRAMP family divalent metal transporter, partial [Salibacteraceae bacterium]
VKYPFFYMGPFYAKQTGKSILSGYEEIGNWALWFFIALTVASMFAVIAAISIVTAGLAENIFNLQINVKIWTSIIVSFCTLVLIIGKYSLLDRLIKWVILILTFTTIIAFLFSFQIDNAQSSNVALFNWDDSLHIIFLIAFVGWMPAPMDISIWHSVWQVEKQNTQADYKINPKGNLDFNIGYIGTGILALLFLSLGSQVFYGSGETLASGGVKFSSQLIKLYSSLLGNWAYWIIAIAAFTTMFSTIITCIDAFPRVLNEAVSRLLKQSKSNYYLLLLILLGVGSQIVIYFYMENMKQMVDFATTVSFLTTPLLAGLSLLAIKNGQKKGLISISPFLIYWSYASIIALSLFALFYLAII